MADEKLTIIDGEYDHWVSLRRIEPTATIADTVQTISCDTRDFHLGWNFKQPEMFKKADCGYEYRTNEGLTALAKMIKNGSIADCEIEPTEILPWLDRICQLSGGYEQDWRYLTARVKHCDGWNIKYIRFVRHPEKADRFIVCNSYMQPIAWREVADNIYDIMDDTQAEKQEEQKPERDKAKEYARLVGRRFRPTFTSNIDHFEFRGYDAERDMVLTRAFPKEGNPFDDEIEEAYLAGGFENGDYEPDYPDSWSEPHTYVLHNYDMPPAPKPLEQKFCGPCCNRCQHRFGRTSNAHWCEQNYQREKCYRFKLEK